MRTTVTLDDDLMSKAREMTGIADNATLIRTALQKMVEREAARRLILLGGSAPDFVAPPRRRFPEADDDSG
jgi:Arc/MetJ family transcription regulator